ncbi:MAG: SDR family oxidoreductase [candidate division NC10 bacterium]|nr:SDR family oxidoreductase [candidate division NC10 bacterium]
MHGKVAMVTGATSGLGLVTARALAQQGARVIVVGRNADRGAATVRHIQQETGNPAVELLVADLSVQAQVRRLASEVQTRFPRLEVLVNNAGALFTRRLLSLDGLEMTFALNHLGYFLLTNLLLDTLRANLPARIVNVSSEAHRGAQINFADLQGAQRYSGWRAYAQSKLANLLFTYELARRLEGSGITANAVHPGFVATNFGRNNRGVQALLWRVLHVAALSPEQGAQTIIYLATSPEVEGLTGRYFVKNQAVPSSKESYDSTAAQRLWQVSAELTGL